MAGAAAAGEDAFREAFAFGMECCDLSGHALFAFGA
jgi:hypothetical protein